MQPFSPVIAQAVSITIAASSARVALPAGYRTFRLHNASTEILYIRFGDVTVTATATPTANLTMPAGGVETFVLPTPIGGTEYYIAAIGTGATGKLAIVPGGSD